MTTIDEALAAASARLAAAGIADPWRDARVLAGAALGRSRESLLAHGGEPLAAESASRFEDCVARRSRGEPVARILGHKEFWSLDFLVTADTLVPRPDSETLIQAALDAIADRRAAVSVLDLGTGTGCLLLALLSELPQARGVGIDISPGAVAVAQRNAALLGLGGRARFRVADFTTESPGADAPRWDVILCNPPYIPEDEIARLAPDVAIYDPPAALSGGADGLAAYRALAPRLAGLLDSGGQILLEIGQGQSEAVTAIMARAGLDLRACHADLAGIPRCLVLTLGDAKKMP